MKKSFQRVIATLNLFQGKQSLAIINLVVPLGRPFFLIFLKERGESLC